MSNIFEILYNPKHLLLQTIWWTIPEIKGHNRGEERLVTVDDQHNWYTNNHYKTFTQIKNK